MNLKYIIFVLVLIAFSSCFQDNGQYYHGKGLIHFGLENYEKAMEAFTKGISIGDAYANVNYLGRGMTYKELEEFDLAQQDFEKVLETEKTNSDDVNRDTYWQLAWVAEAKGEKDNERSYYERALRYDPDNKELKMTYGLILIENDAPQKGVDLLSTLINADYEDPYVFNNRALGFIKLEQYEQAVTDLQKSIELDNKNPFVYKNYALLHDATNQPDLACQFIDKALSLDIMDYGVRKNILEFEKLKSQFCL